MTKGLLGHLCVWAIPKQ